ncbi:C2H2 finger domain-containing protein [Trichophyton tonsurans CBS 112818]|uniref:C2H2 finger domain-containing protein n=1 Tax=Trichophyton tonsurans (strain CBS 112818) TaxID=647933 RepID=F2RPJ1_TRIT1|nr:C2H2 finger domain-containing protein [Trichophyton tonsurans CBS 112818]
MGSIRRSKTKRRTRDYDQVVADLRSRKHLTQYHSTKYVEDLPGLGKHYCVECAKWLESEYNLVAHRKGKNHKRRLRMLLHEPHTQKTAEAAIGLGVDNGTKTTDNNAAMMEVETDV